MIGRSVAHYQILEKLGERFANGTTAATYNVLEADLASKPSRAGARQPSGSGVATIDLKLNDAPWLQLRIPNDAARSNVTDGRAIGNVPEGALLTADLNAQNAGKNLRIILA